MLRLSGKYVWEHKICGSTERRYFEREFMVGVRYELVRNDYNFVLGINM